MCSSNSAIQGIWGKDRADTANLSIGSKSSDPNGNAVLSPCRGKGKGELSGLLMPPIDASRGGGWEERAKKEVT